MLLQAAKTLILVFTSITLLVNIPFVWQWHQNTASWLDDLKQSNRKFLKPGYQYADLRPHLHEIERIGYLTDYNLGYTSAELGNYLSAQYALVPTALEAKSTDHQTLLLDFQSLEKAWQKINELKANPIAINPHQKILVQKP